MKRFLMFLVIAIAVVSLGLTIYYFSVDNEMIYIKSSYLVVNAGKSFSAEGENGLLDFRNRADSTTLTYSIQQEDEDKEVLQYFEKEKIFRAVNGGEAKIIVKTNNRSYSRLVIDVLVCDGSENYPYMVNNEEELIQMDQNKSYKLNNDIELTNNWTPISFNGVLDGNYHAIKGLKITDDEIANTVNVGFISILGGTIKNLQLVDVDINVSKAVTLGAFAGRVNGNKTIIDNVEFQYGLIQTSEATGTITSTNTVTSSKVGGVAGSINNSAKIDRCGFDGKLAVTGSSIVAGGIAGENNNSVISESYAREVVDNGTYSSTVFGGIVGENSGKDGNLYDCYFYAKQEPSRNSQTEIAGIVYRKSGDGLVTGCYYGGKMNAIGGSSTSGLVNSGDLKSTSNSYLDDSIQGFKNSNKFITTQEISTGEIRTWNFNGVWTLTSENYPILNVESSVGSIYDIDTSEITTTDKIYDAASLYQKVSNNEECVVSGNLDMKGYVWKVISNEFNQIFAGENNAKISNFIIDATDVTDGYVGLVNKMGSNAKIKDITFENVSIITNGGQTFNRVGILAGESNGAQVNNVKIINADINVIGFADSTRGTSYFGSFFGFANTGTVLNRVMVEDIDVTDGYFTMAGGFIGAGYATISASGSLGANKLYNYANNVKLIASYAGGIVGANAGSISYTTANDIQYNNENNTTSNQYTKEIYKSGLKKIFVGGIVGTNEFKLSNGSRTKGTILDVYSNAFNLKASTIQGFKTYFGGIAGFNSNDISRAYVKSASMVLNGSHNGFVGGITGYNSGKISFSVVDANSRISTNIVASVGTSSDKNNYILNTDNCTIVGGIVGYDMVTTNNTNSIYKSATYMKEIKGYYAGGISGISFGKVQYSYCGESTKADGGVTITGFLAGGLSSVVAGGYMKNCYTFCRLNAVNEGTYKNILSVIKMEVSAVGGLTVFALNGGTTIESCYAVASYSARVSYGSSADLTGIVCGTIVSCVYQNTGSAQTRNGKQLSQANLKGNPNYSAFKNAISTNGNLSSWDFPSGSGYPTISGVNVNFPSSNLPVFH